MAAEQALRKLAQDDSRQVATAASVALRATSDVTAGLARPVDQRVDTDLEGAVST